MALRQVHQFHSFDIRTLIDEFLLDYAGTSPRTIQHYEDQVGRVLRNWLLAHELTDLMNITVRDMRRYMADQAAPEAKLGPSSISTRFTRANRFFNWCIEQGYLGEGDNPMRTLRRPKPPKQSRVAFDRAEVSRMFKVLAAKPGWIGARDRAIVTVLLGTGARATELTLMTLNDLDWPHKRILLHGKGEGGQRKDRRVPMGKGTMNALREYLKVRPKVATPMLWLTLQKRPIAYMALEHMVRNLGEYAGVEPVFPHRFRHTFATEHYLANRDLIALKNVLGHENVTVTLRYLERLGVSYMGGDESRSPDEWLV